ncbi:Troponin C, slow skeletal and cardiac muscles like [Actinidia chinensis var. chinensis]|uniref:Troponin C, slow skeletal and cardiac muscles like n=1 Tax=Actinidia chinensis var. chinensis TaxID=1590841 RepID=A0A2R6QCL4_ACTCC|nr:Troponin C, slow skeletal and cardiac muscles like [Actinidia chinensis var. chinensis]
MGLLAGSTVMLLTVIWGTCVVVGKCDIEHSVAIDGKDTKGCSLTDKLRVLPSHELRDDGTPNKEIIEKLFRTVDGNGDGYISTDELKALIMGIRFDEIDLDEDDAVEKVMKDFDTSLDHQIDLQEFICGIEKWLEEVRRYGSPPLEAGAGTIKNLDDFHRNTKREHDLLGDASDEVVEGVENPKRTTIKAVLLLLLGTLIAAAFADPLVDAVNNFSDATSIPTFFISFIALPFANSSMAVSAIIFATRKRLRSTSLTFSELYGAVTMNNVLCLPVFLALLYIRGLTWDFSAEVLVIVIVCVVMGAFASFRTTFPLWTAILAFLLYPFSLALVYVLDYVLGWS